MSTIRIDNFGPSAGGTTYSARGIAKAWVNFNGTGTIAARDSENVSSLTDNGTGDYTVSYSNSFSSANYQIATSANNTTANYEWHLSPYYGSNPTVSQTRCAGSAGGSLSDMLYLNAAIDGDLA